jgi:DNA polymerase-3 subunit epsilon
VIDKGRQKGEKSLVYIENGSLKGMGYAPFHFRRSPMRKWMDFLEIIQDDRDARNILKLFLRKNEKHEIVYLES